MMATPKDRLTKKELNQSFWAYFNWCLCVFGMERLQAPGITLAMMPIINHYYKNDEKAKIALLKRHRVFFNTEPDFGQLIIGLVLRLEEAKAQGKDITDDYIQNVKVGLMGPLAGIGDAIFQGTLPPIVLSIIIGLITSTKSPWPIFLYWVLWYGLTYFASRYFFKLGYEVGESSVETVLGSGLADFEQTLSVLGLVVTGALAANYVNVNLLLNYSNELTKASVNVQTILDGIFPKLLSIALVLLGYWLLTKKHLKPIQLMGIFALITIVGSLIGII